MSMCDLHTSFFKTIFVFNQPEFSNRPYVVCYTQFCDDCDINQILSVYYLKCFNLHINSLQTQHVWQIDFLHECVQDKQWSIYNTNPLIVPHRIVKKQVTFLFYEVSWSFDEKCLRYDMHLEKSTTSYRPTQAYTLYFPQIKV